jgi:hypothetical protein
MDLAFRRADRKGYDARLLEMRMRRLVACLLVATFALAPIVALARAAGQGNGAIVASVHATDGRSLAGLWARIRSLSDGRQLASADIATGQTTFDVPVGSYLVEVVDGSGAVLGTSNAVSLTEAAPRADAVVSLGDNRPTGGNFFKSTKGIILMSAAGAGITGAVAYNKIKKSKKK